MKTILLLFSLLVLDPEAYLRQDNTRAGANTNSYEFIQTPATPAPAGFKPFYISHYGRHGSRSSWGTGYYDTVIRELEKAGQLGILSASGDSLLSETRRALEGYDGMDGHLTARGVREHKAIAARMYKSFPEVFRGSKRIFAVSSESQRCIISMCAFTNSLQSLNPRLDIHPDTGGQFVRYICRDWPGPDFGHKCDSIQAASGVYDLPEDSVSVLRRLFTDPVRAREMIHSVHDLQAAIFDVAATAENFDIQENLFRYLPFNVIYRYWAARNMNLFLRNCNSVELGEERLPMADLQIQDIVWRADAAIGGTGVAADLRFGHDYPLLGLVSAMGLTGVGERYSVNEINRHWLGFFEIPMGSNLQIIFYRNRHGEVLVKFLYNETERGLIGVTPYSGPYYRWEDVKAAWQRWL